MTVHNVLKPGLREKTYERALVMELAKQGLKVEQQKRFDVIYDGVVIDQYIPDLLVNCSVIVDAKCVDAFTDTHTSQMVGYLAITDPRLGLLINFRFARLHWKRVIR